MNQTILDGNIGNPGSSTDNAYHVVYFQDSSSEMPTKLSGFTVRNGRADGPGDFNNKGGGIHVVYTPDGPPTGAQLNRLIVEDNFASEGGGGIRIAGKQTTYLTNCVFRRNTTQGANFGGGGALIADHDDPFGPAYVAQNCVFYENTAVHGNGGAIAYAGLIVNCTFYDNQCLDPNDGAGAYWATSGPNGIPSLYNSIVWDNSEPQLLGVSAFYSNVEDASWSAGSQFNLSSDPFFRDPTNEDFTLRACSPSIDMAADPEIVTDTTDLDDNANTTEATPWDEKKVMRVIQYYFDPALPEPDPNNAETWFVDMGAYEECPADVNGDGTVGLSDLAISLELLRDGRLHGPVLLAGSP